MLKPEGGNSPRMYVRSNQEPQGLTWQGGAEKHQALWECFMAATQKTKPATLLGRHVPP